MKLSQKICGVILATSLIFIPAQKSAEAGFFNELLEFAGEILVNDPETYAIKNADEVLDALWKSSVLMEESKLCVAEALNFKPSKIAAYKESIRQMTFDRHDMNAIRVSTYNEIPEDVLEYGISKLLSDEDRAMDENIQTLMKRSQLARHAAHGYNQGALGHVAKAIYHIQLLKERDPYAADRAMGYLIQRLGDAQELLTIQHEQSKMFHQVFNVFNRKYNIKEPTKKEIKRIEKELLPS